MNGFFKKIIYSWFRNPQFTRFRNLRMFIWMNQYAKNAKVLNLGSGVGNFDHYLSKDINMINLDIEPAKPGLNVIADAHFLPFKSGSLDIIYGIAVLEHVKKPWIVADEITRVLRVGGHVVLEIPFLNVIHDSHDYFRFTDEGIRSLFGEKFKEVSLQISCGGGSFLSVFAFSYFRQFVPTVFGKKLWDFFMRYFFSLFKYFDIFIDKSLSMRITANSFSYIGRKL